MQAIGPWVLTYALQVVIAGIFLWGIRYRDAKVATNAGGALFVSLTPYLAQWTYHTHVGWPVVFWTTTAGFLHTLGAKGLYSMIGWWDHVAHTISGGLVAMLISAIVVVAAGPPTASNDSMVGYGLVMSFVVGWGVFWELLECISQRVSRWLDNSVMLTQDGARDGILDISFNILGAGIVLLVPGSIFTPLVRHVPLVNATFLHTLILVVIGLDLALGLVVASARVWDRAVSTANHD
ncbi:MAG TPA: hypothetical protein VFJ06_08650 [Halococcus sp.]|nr:hypothetical protein [Halococcus sp.]